jgi:hypothetical protein
VRVERVARDDGHLWQQVGERADRRALARAAVAHDHDAADLGVEDVEEERELHLLLPDDGREGEDGAGVAEGLAGGGGGGGGLGDGGGAGRAQERGGALRFCFFVVFLVCVLGQRAGGEGGR